MTRKLLKNDLVNHIRIIEESLTIIHVLRDGPTEDTVAICQPWSDELEKAAAGLPWLFPTFSILLDVKESVRKAAHAMQFNKLQGQGWY